MFQPDPILILPYIGYHSPTKLYLRGRVIEDEGIQDGVEDRFIKIIRNNFRRFETDEIANAHLKLTYLGIEYELTTDEEGFYQLEVALPYDLGLTPIKNLDYQVELLKATGYPDQKVYATGSVLRLNSNADFGIISDIDDTVLQSHMTSFLKLKMLRKTFTANAHGRSPMEGMVHLYQQLVLGSDGKQENPFFYLSDSPWNLYGTITNFMENEGLPIGPLFLRDFGFNRGVKRKEFKEHKRINIARILNDFPDLPFVFFGDTASHDADYYLEALEEFPHRVKAIYIRQTKLNKNARRIQKLVTKTNKDKLLIVENSTEMLADLKAKKLIS